MIRTLSEKGLQVKSAKGLQALSVKGLQTAACFGSIYGKTIALTLLLVLAPLLSIVLSHGIALAADHLHSEALFMYNTPRPDIHESEMWPCSQCHAAMETNTKKRKLMFHTEKKITRHGEPERWCLDCHNADDRDYLKLINGKLVSFDHTERLCGQCHGSLYNDWKAGVHGKRVGMWNGEKQYFRCPFCHNPHSPRFKSIKPEKPPLRPDQTLRGVTQRDFIRYESLRPRRP